MFSLTCLSEFCISIVTKVIVILVLSSGSFSVCCLSFSPSLPISLLSGALQFCLLDAHVLLNESSPKINKWGKNKGGS